MEKTEQNEFYTEKDIAGILRVSISTIRKWRGKKVGPPFKMIAGTIRYSKYAFEQYIEDCTVQTTPRFVHGKQSTN